MFWLCSGRAHNLQVLHEDTLERCTVCSTVCMSMSKRAESTSHRWLQQVKHHNASGLLAHHQSSRLSHRLRNNSRSKLVRAQFGRPPRFVFPRIINITSIMDQTFTLDYLHTSTRTLANDSNSNSDPSTTCPCLELALAWPRSPQRWTDHYSGNTASMSLAKVLITNPIITTPVTPQREVISIEVGNFPRYPHSTWRDSWWTMNFRFEGATVQTMYLPSIHFWLYISLMSVRTDPNDHRMR